MEYETKMIDKNRIFFFFLNKGWFRMYLQIKICQSEKEGKKTNKSVTIYSKYLTIDLKSKNV